MSLKSTIEQTCAYAATTRKPHTGHDNGYADYQYKKAKNHSSITSVEPLFWDKPAGWDKLVDAPKKAKKVTSKDARKAKKERMARKKAGPQEGRPPVRRRGRVLRGLP
ncbi:translational elongation factor EF-1 alpha [Rhodotorula sphaerocarpa]